mgnify:CR=1 FL=1
MFSLSLGLKERDDLFEKDPDVDLFGFKMELAGFGQRKQAEKLLGGLP